MDLVDAAHTWTVEAYVGNAYNFRSRLRIEQDGGFSRSLNAKYDTRGFESPPYYMLRAGKWKGSYATELSVLHHKLYLKNAPAGVSDLSISHGFNILTLNGAYRIKDWTYRFGAGPVLTHAEATINGIKYDGPYRLSGIAMLAGAGRRFYVAKSTFISVEAMATAAYAAPRMSGSLDGKVRVTNLALHALAGIGREF
jgi:hypothetical protein